MVSAYRCAKLLISDMELEKKSPAAPRNDRATLRRISSMLDKYKYVEKAVDAQLAAQDLSQKSGKKDDGLKAPEDMVVDEKGDADDQQSAPTEPQEVVEPAIAAPTDDAAGIV